MRTPTSHEGPKPAMNAGMVDPARRTGKTIWIINQYAGSKYHGMVFRHYYLGREFVKLGHRVYVISASFTHLQRQHPKTSGPFTTENIDGIEYVWVRVPSYTQSTSVKRALSMLAFAFRISRLNAGAMERPDAIILSSPSPLPLLTVRSWCKRFGAKFVFEVRDIWPLSLIEIAGVSRFHPFVMMTAWFERSAYKTADYVVSVLPGIADYTSRFQVPPQKVHYIPNGVSLEDCKSAVGNAQNVPSLIPTRGFVVGYAGALSLANSLNHFVTAAELLKHRDDIHFVILGDGGLKDALRKQASHLSNVIFVDAVPKADVPDFIARFDLCYAGRGEQAVYQYGVSPNKLFDYMIAGKPVLHSTNTPHDPVSYSGCGQAIPSGDAKAIADAIEGFAALTAEQRQEIGLRGRRFVLEHHTYERLAKEYVRILV